MGASTPWVGLQALFCIFFFENCIKIKIVEKGERFWRHPWIYHRFVLHYIKFMLDMGGHHFRQGYSVTRNVCHG